MKTSQAVAGLETVHGTRIQSGYPKMDRHENVEVRHFVSSIFRLQMAMISIIDDSSKLLSNNLKINQQHPRYSIMSKLF